LAVRASESFLFPPDRLRKKGEVEWAAQNKGEKGEH